MLQLKSPGTAVQTPLRNEMYTCLQFGAESWARCTLKVPSKSLTLSSFDNELDHYLSSGFLSFHNCLFGLWLS